MGNWYKSDGGWYDTGKKFRSDAGLTGDSRFECGHLGCMDHGAIVRTAFLRENVSAEPAGPRLPILLAVAGLHIALMAALGLLFRAGRTPLPPPPIGIPVIFVPDAPERSDPLPKALPASTLSVPIPQLRAALAPLPRLTLTVPANDAPVLIRSAARRTKETPGPPHIAPPSPSPSATTMRRQETAPARLSPAAHETQPAMASWEARIRQAVQDAAIYPASARLLRRQGSAQIRFDYDRGAIAVAAVARSSHCDALDNAALAAVTRAVIPTPPAELGPQKRTMLVWVQFTLVPEE